LFACGSTSAMPTATLTASSVTTIFAPMGISTCWGLLAVSHGNGV
jgi:hypothetical protein